MPHFTDEEGETQRSAVSCPKSQTGRGGCCITPFIPSPNAIYYTFPVPFITALYLHQTLVLHGPVLSASPMLTYESLQQPYKVGTTIIPIFGMRNYE